MEPILRTIREVEESLERRVKRAAGVNLMIWGLVSASIFVFYQLVEWNPGPYKAALGPAHDWVWLAPIAIGYVASALVGTRLGRFGGDRGAARDYRKGMIPGAIATALAALLIVTQRGDLIPGALVLVTGACFLAYGERRTTTGRVCIVLGAVLLLAGATLMAWRGSLTSLFAAFAMGGGLLLTGTLLYRSAR